MTRTALPSRLVVSDAAPFVGRAVELDTLRAAWSASRSGEHRLVLVAGEPGVGKTRLASELAVEAHRDGGWVLYGGCDDASPFAYQPFASVLAELVQGCPLEALAAYVDRYGGDLTRLVPELRELVPDAPVPVRGDPEVERYRLFESVVGLCHVAADRPLLFVLDDLHWAARPALLLLRHIVRSPKPMSLLVVATYRSTELSRDHPLADMLVDYRPKAERVALSGLDQMAVANLLASAVGATSTASSDEFAMALHRETSGNPLFVTQVLRHLADTSRLDVGRRTSSGTFAIPEGLREVIGQRLNRLSEPANRLLAAAAVGGNEFDFEVLEHAAGTGDDSDDQLGALEEAIAAGLIEDASGPGTRYAFTHAVVRQTLLLELSTARRAQLHRRVGEAIEAIYGANVGRYAAELAQHFAEAGALDDPNKAARYSLIAARQAVEQLGFEAAVDHLERALGLLDAADSGTSTVRFDLLVSLADAKARLFDLPGAKQAALGAAEVARASGDGDRLATAARACVIVRAAVLDTDVVELCEESLAALGPTDSSLRAEVLATLANHRALAGDRESADLLAQEALAVARRVSDPDAIGLALFSRYAALWGSSGAEDQLTVAEEVLTIARDSGDVLGEGNGFGLRAPCHLMLGNRAAFEEDATDFTRIADQLRWPFGLMWSALWSVLTAMLDGEFDLAEERTATVLDRIGDNPDFLAAYMAQMFWLRMEQGRLGDIRPVVDLAVAQNPELIAFRAARGVVQAELGETNDARVTLDELAAEDFRGIPRDLTWPASIAHLAELGARVGDREHAERLYDLLLPHSGQFMIVAAGVYCPGSADRLLGMLAARAERTAAAEVHYRAALDLEQRITSPPLAARTCYWHARLLVEQCRDRTSEAEQLLAACEATSHQLGMPALARQTAQLRQELE